MKYVIMTALSFALAAPAIANELDPAPSKAPKGLMVRVAPNGKADVFKIQDGKPVKDDSAAMATLESVATPGNLIHPIKGGSELDRDSSHEAWFYWHRPWATTAGVYPYYYSYATPAAISPYYYYPYYTYYAPTTAAASPYVYYYYYY